MDFLYDKSIMVQAELEKESIDISNYLADSIVSAGGCFKDSDSDSDKVYLT